MLMSSGPVELLFRDFLMASITCCCVILYGVDGSLKVCLSVIRFREEVLCGIMFVNCLLNASALSVLVMAV